MVFMSVSNLVTNFTEIYVNPANKYMLKIDNRKGGKSWKYVKACVRYFHQIFIFSPNDSSFRSRDIQFFLFLFFSLFLPVGHCLRG